ncbi:MAG: ABC transporter substrate-binding protein [Pseudonocardia sp.]
MRHEVGRPCAEYVSSLPSARCRCCWRGACGESTGSGTFPLAVSNCDRQVSIEKRPERIVTNGPDALNLVAAAGGAELVVARASEFGQELRGPAREAAQADVLDAQHDLSTEVVINTGAQLLVSNPDYLADPRVVDQLSQAGIATLFGSGYCEGQRADFEDVYADIELLGRLFGTEDRAASSVADLRNRVAAFQSGRGDRPRRTAVHAQIYENVTYAAGARSMEQTQLEILGLANIFADSEDEFIEPSLEELIARDPEALILQYGFTVGDGPPKTFEQARQEFLALPGVTGIRAVRDGAVVGVPFYETAADPLAVDGLATIEEALRAARPQG